MVALPRLWSEQKDPVPSDDELTKDLLSASGPTFRVEDKKLHKKWSLIAYGDMRFTDPANLNVTNPKVRRWLVNQIAKEYPDALLLSGDVPYDGSVENDYEIYYAETESWRRKKLRIYPAMGNHELHENELREPRNWWHAFPDLNGRRWYSVQFGDTYIITLDSNLSLIKGSRQHTWLVDQLTHLPESTSYVLISLHHPPVADPLADSHSHDVRPNEHSLAVLLEEQATSSRAAFIVVAGHIHNYERFLQRGVTYIVSGGGGAKPHPVARSAADLYQSADFPNYHYLKFARNGHGLSAVMIRLRNPEGSDPSWEIRDTFSVTPR